MKLPRLRDFALPAALAASATIERAAGNLEPASSVVYALLIAVMVTPLAWMRAAPLGALIGCIVGVDLVTGVIGSGDGPTTLLLTLMIASYGAGANRNTRHARIAGGLIVVSAVTAPLTSLASGSPLGPDDAIFALVLGGIPWVGGRINARRRARAEELDALAAQLEEARDEHTRAAVTAERARIAAELNDAIAHGVAELMIQAGAAAQLLVRDPDAAERALRSVQERGRATLAELRRMLVVMRADQL